MSLHFPAPKPGALRHCHNVREERHRVQCTRFDRGKKAHHRRWPQEPQLLKQSSSCAEVYLEHSHQPHRREPADSGYWRSRWDDIKAAQDASSSTEAGCLSIVFTQYLQTAAATTSATVHCRPTRFFGCLHCSVALPAGCLDGFSDRLFTLVEAGGQCLTCRMDAYITMILKANDGSHTWD